MMISALLSIIIFNSKLKKHGFVTMYKKYVKDCECHPARLHSPDEAVRIDKAIVDWANVLEQTCILVPFEAKCIHKSFILYKIIRKKYQVRISLVVGVNPFPFSAHAWLKIGDSNIFEDDYETSKYIIMLRSDETNEVGTVEHKL